MYHMLVTDTSSLLYHAHQPLPFTWDYRYFSWSCFYHLPLPFSHGGYTFCFPSLFNCLLFISQFVFLTQADKICHTHANSSSRFPPSIRFPLPSSMYMVAGNVAHTLSRYLLYVLVNTVRAVKVMYGCNPTAAARHSCQLPWETRWFIFCSFAYGPI